MVKKNPQKQSPLWGSPVKRDQYTIVLEDLRSHFKVFGENLDMTRESLGRQMKELQIEMIKTQERIGALEVRVGLIEERLGLIEERIGGLDVRVAQLEQANLELLREIRQNTVSRSEFEQLREHVRKLEARIAH